jgi:hypothetical protein
MARDLMSLLRIAVVWVLGLEMLFCTKSFGSKFQVATVLCPAGSGWGTSTPQLWITYELGILVGRAQFHWRLMRHTQMSATKCLLRGCFLLLAVRSLLLRTSLVGEKNM